MKIFWCILFAGVTAGLTLVVRLPIPGTGGYLNLGDMAVVFCGLYLGGRWGFVAGGIGSAAADIIGGFFVFAPVTLIAKGLEAFIAGTLGKKSPYWLALAAATMVSVYFVAEIFLPGIGLAAALSELPFNLIQAVAGAVGGLLIYKGVTLSLPKGKSKENVRNE